VHKNKNILPQNEITVFGSLQSQKRNEFRLSQNILGLIWPGITHEGEKRQISSPENKISPMLDGAISCHCYGTMYVTADYRKRDKKF
jgi:hypothetical protein